METIHQFIEWYANHPEIAVLEIVFILIPAASLALTDLTDEYYDCKRNPEQKQQTKEE